MSIFREVGAALAVALIRDCERGAWREREELREGGAGRMDGRQRVRQRA